MKSVGKVLDISYAQGNLTQAAVQKIREQNVLGVILRIGFTGYGQGTPTIDRCFEHNYKLLHDAGIPCGAYYFTLAYNDSIATREINWLKTELAKKKFELPIYIDCEDIHPKDPTPISNAWNNCLATIRTNNIKRICEALEAEKYYVGIYASKSYFGPKLIDSELKSFDKWIAQYWFTCTYGGTYHLWQYTSSGNGALYGINGRVDVSECYLNFPEVIKNAGLNGYGKVTICPLTGKICNSI